MKCYKENRPQNNFKKHAHLISSLVISIALSGCATAPPMPHSSYSPGDKIGLLIETYPTPSHTHIGTTVFNNFTKTYSYHWKLDEEVPALVNQALKNAGFTTLDLKSTGIQYADVNNLIESQDGQWRIVPGRQAMVQLLKEQLGLKGVIVVKEKRVMTALECSGGPCSERYSDTSGLYTRSFFGLTRYYAVAAYEWNIYLLDPVADAAKTQPLLTKLRIPAAPLKDFSEPKNFKLLAEEEFQPVKEAILKFTDDVTAQAIAALGKPAL